MSQAPDVQKKVLDSERKETLRELEELLETPLIALGFVWLALLVIELAFGLSPLLEIISTVIWIIFILDFAVRFLVAPAKITFLKSNILTAISLLVPALRVFRLARVVRVLRLTRATRGIQMVRLLSTVNRGMKGLRATMTRRGVGYVFALTLAVLLVGAGGMYSFESSLPGGGGLNSYSAALWWTAMLMTTIGSEYWPQTPEGRVLCFLIALYAAGVFGYITATLATFFVGQDATDDNAEIASAASIQLLTGEIAALRAEVQALDSALRGRGGESKS